MSILSRVAARVLTPIGLFALALAVRLLPWPTVIEKGQVVFFGMDAWYHMRRARIALVQGGWPPAFDSFLNFPDGGMPIWPPLFDALVAGWVWPWGAVWGWPAAERAAALLPPVLGAVCVVVLYRLALRLFDATIAVVASVGLAFLSAHFWYSQIGFVDHHVAVSLAALMLLAAGTRFVGSLAEGDRSPWGSAAFTGALCAGCLLLWPGTILHVGIVVLALGVAWLSRTGGPDSDEDALRGAHALALSGAVAFVLVAPVGWSAGWEGARAFSPTVLSRFQPWMFASLVALAVVCSLAIRRGWFGDSPGRRAVSALVMAGALLGLGLVAIPQLSAGVDEAWRWFTKDEAFQGLVRESKPLFVAATGFDTHNAELRLSRLLYLLPIAVAALAVSARRSPRAASIWLLVGWTVVLAVATLLQRRFFNSLAPAFALVLAWGFVSLLRGIPRWMPDGSVSLRRTLQVVAVALALWLYAPTLAAYRLPASNLLQRLRGESMTVPRAELSRRVLIEAAKWLRDNTPPTGAPFDPSSRPSYGVMAPWGYGHLLKYVALRPTVVGNFGDDVGGRNLRLSNAYYASPEPEAVVILDELQARYVLVRGLGDVPVEQQRGVVMRKRLSANDSPGLQHHRLLYESPLDGVWAKVGRSEFRIFERVEGARLTGVALAGSSVVAELGYRSNRGRKGRFETAAVAGPDGRYEIRLPYATRGSAPGVVTEGEYRVRSAGRVVEVVVDEREVLAGATLAGPDF